MDWIHLALGRDRWWAVVDTVMLLLFPQNEGVLCLAENVLASQEDFCPMELDIFFICKSFWRSWMKVGVEPVTTYYSMHLSVLDLLVDTWVMHVKCRLISDSFQFILVQFGWQGYNASWPRTLIKTGPFLIEQVWSEAEHLTCNQCIYLNCCSWPSSTLSLNFKILWFSLICGVSSAYCMIFWISIIFVSLQVCVGVYDMPAWATCSSQATCCPWHSVMLPTEIFEIMRMLSNTFPCKAEVEHWKNSEKLLAVYLRRHALHY